MRVKIWIVRAMRALLLGRLAVWRLLRLSLSPWSRRFVRLVGGFVGLKLCFATGAGGGWLGLSRF